MGTKNPRQRIRQIGHRPSARATMPSLRRVERTTKNQRFGRGHQRTQLGTAPGLSVKTQNIESPKLGTQALSTVVELLRQIERTVQETDNSTPKE